MRFSVLFFMVALSGCMHTDAESHHGDNQKSVVAQPVNTQSPEETDMQNVTEKLKEAYFTVKGTIVYKNLEGGFYGLDADNGRKYLPHGLAMKYRKNGLVVEVSGTIEKEMMSFKQYGEILKVKSVTVIDDTKVKQENYY